MCKPRTSRRRPIRRNPAENSRHHTGRILGKQRPAAHHAHVRRIHTPQQRCRKSGNLAPTARTTRNTRLGTQDTYRTARLTAGKHDIHNRLLRRYRRQQRRQPDGKLCVRILDRRKHRHHGSVGQSARRLQPRTGKRNPRRPALQP